MSIKNKKFKSILDLQTEFTEDIMASLPVPKWSSSLLAGDNKEKIDFLLKNSSRNLMPTQLEMAVLPILELFKTSKSALLIGSMGIGKTTIANSIALSLLNGTKGINVLFLSNGSKHTQKMKREACAVMGNMVRIFEISSKAIDYDVFMSYSVKKRENLNQFKNGLIRIEDIQKIKKEDGIINYFILSKDEGKRDYVKETISNKTCPSCNFPVEATSSQLKDILDDDKSTFYKKVRKVLDSIEENKNNKKRWSELPSVVEKCLNCNNSLYNAKGKNFSIARKIKKMANKVSNKVFDFLIVDEVHDMQDPDSAQTKTYRAAVNASRKILIMTGTLSNGKASSVFHILYPILAKRFKDFGGFDYNKIEMFIDFFGARRSTITIDRRTGKVKESGLYEIAKINDRIIAFLLPFSVWMSISDLGIDMVKFTEEIKVVPLDEENNKALSLWKNRISAIQCMFNENSGRIKCSSARNKVFEDAIIYRMNNFHKQYTHKVAMNYRFDLGYLKSEVMDFVNVDMDGFINNIKRDIIETIINSAVSGIEFTEELSTYGTYEEKRIFLGSILDVSDVSIYQKRIKENEIFEEYIMADFVVSVSSVQLSDESVLSSKEEELISVLNAEIAQKRRTLLYTDYNGANEIQTRLENVISSKGISVAVMDSSVQAKDIEQWMIDSTEDVIIVNQVRVATGLDLVMFHTTLFYEISSKIRIVQQAKVRPWRPVGQKKDVKAIYLGYREFQNNRIVNTAQKMRAAAAVEGDILSEDSIAYIYDYSPEITAAIAEITRNISGSEFESSLKIAEFSEIATYFKGKVVIKNAKQYKGRVSLRGKVKLKNKEISTSLLEEFNKVCKSVSIDNILIDNIVIEEEIEEEIEEKIEVEDKVEVEVEDKVEVEVEAKIEVETKIDANNQLMFVF